MSKEWIQTRAASVKFALEVGRDPDAARRQLLSMATDLGGDPIIASRMEPSSLALYLLVLLLAAP